MAFQKHEYGKKKVKRNPAIPPAHDVRAEHQRGTDNTKLYNILKSKKFSRQDRKSYWFEPCIVETHRRWHQISS